MNIDKKDFDLLAFLSVRKTESFTDVDIVKAIDIDRYLKDRISATNFWDRRLVKWIKEGFIELIKNKPNRYAIDRDIHYCDESLHNVIIDGKAEVISVGEHIIIVYDDGHVITYSPPKNGNNC